MFAGFNVLVNSKEKFYSYHESGLSIYNKGLYALCELSYQPRNIARKWSSDPFRKEATCC